MIVLRALRDVPRFATGRGSCQLRRGDVVGGLPFAIVKVLVDRRASVVIST